MSDKNPTRANLTGISFDRFKPVLDIKNTDLGAVLRYLANDYFKANTLAGITELDGIIVRVIHDSKNFNWSIFNLINSTIDTNKMRYKVWVPDIHFMLDNEEERKKQNQNSYIPSDNLEYGRYVISSLPDFIVTNSQLSNLSVGDRVRVTFTDISMFKGGIIKEKINNTSNGEATSTAGVGSASTPATPSASASSAFSSSAPSSTVENQPDDEEILLYKRNGDPDRKVKARKIPSTDGSKKLLPVQMAEDFKLMAKEAKNANPPIILTANSAYRTPEDQIKLFDERWIIKYSEGKPRNLPVNQGGKNQLNSTGLTSGIAAYPGKSPHNRGVAVDIQIGGGRSLRDKFKSTVYMWLKENAYKYGFFNTGALIKSTPEAWHWTYIPENKGNKQAIITPPKDTYSE